MLGVKIDRVGNEVTIEGAGMVSGDVTVIGGVAHVIQTQIRGQLAVYDENLPYRQSGERITRTRSRTRPM